MLQKELSGFLFLIVVIISSRQSRLFISDVFQRLKFSLPIRKYHKLRVSDFWIWCSTQNMYPSHYYTEEENTFSENIILLIIYNTVWAFIFPIKRCHRKSIVRRKRFTPGNRHVVGAKSKHYTKALFRSRLVYARGAEVIYFGKSRRNVETL